MLCIGEHKLSPEERLLQLRKEERYCCLFSWFIDGTHGTLLTPPGLCSSYNSFLMTSFFSRVLHHCMAPFFHPESQHGVLVCKGGASKFMSKLHNKLNDNCLCRFNVFQSKHTYSLLNDFSCIYIQYYNILYTYIIPRTVYLICSIIVSMCTSPGYLVLFGLVLSCIVCHFFCTVQHNIKLCHHFAA